MQIVIFFINNILIIETETSKLLLLSNAFKNLAQQYYLKEIMHDEYIEAVAMTLFASGFILFFKGIITFCPCFVLINDNPLKDAVYALFREVMVVSLGAVILAGFNYYDILGTDEDNIISLTYAILLGALIYILLGFMLIVCAEY